MNEAEGTGLGAGPRQSGPSTELRAQPGLNPDREYVVEVARLSELPLPSDRVESLVGFIASMKAEQTALRSLPRSLVMASIFDPRWS